MAVAMFDGKDICFTAFSTETTSESLAFLNWLMENHDPTSVSTLYWGGDAIKDALPEGVRGVEIAGPQEIESEHFLGINTIVRHPVTRPDLLPQDRNITSMTKVFFELCPAPIIGVTGTKGKGTTATLITNILRAAGRKVHLLGNIGKPAMNELANIEETDLVVFELSSFQLWDLDVSPHLAVILMIVAEHMDVHTDMREYVDAKSHIAKHQLSKDLVVYDPNNQFSSLIGKMSPGKKLPFQTREGAQVIGSDIVLVGQPLMTTAEVGLLGAHNLENACAAITAAWQFTKDTKAIVEEVTKFKGLEHRLEFLGQVNDVSFFNDSFATSPEPTIAAIKAIDVPKVLILGGSSKKADFSQLSREINAANMRAVIAIGQEGPKIVESLKVAGADGFLIVEAFEASTIGEVVNQSILVAKPGDAIMLSPACASFDMFKNYKVRGELFKKYVEGLTSK